VQLLGTAKCQGKLHAQAGKGRRPTPTMKHTHTAFVCLNSTAQPANKALTLYLCFKEACRTDTTSVCGISQQDLLQCSRKSTKRVNNTGALVNEVARGLCSPVCLYAILSHADPSEHCTTCMQRTNKLPRLLPPVPIHVAGGSFSHSQIDFKWESCL